MDNASIKKLEADLWGSADLLRAGSKLTSISTVCLYWACCSLDMHTADIKWLRKKY